MGRVLLEDCIAKTYLPPIKAHVEPGRWASTLRTGQARAAAREAIERARDGDEARCMSALVLAEVAGGYEHSPGLPVATKAVAKASRRLATARAAAAKAAHARREAEAVILSSVLAEVSLPLEARIAGSREDGLYLRTEVDSRSLVRQWITDAGTDEAEVSAESAIARWSFDEILHGLVVTLETMADRAETRAVADGRRVVTLRAILTLLGAGG